MRRVSMGVAVGLIVLVLLGTGAYVAGRHHQGGREPVITGGRIVPDVTMDPSPGRD